MSQRNFHQYAQRNIRNAMSIEDIVNETGAWYYQPSNFDQSHANPQPDIANWHS
jgi:hypothetical protein